MCLGLQKDICLPLPVFLPGEKYLPLSGNVTLNIHRTSVNLTILSYKGW